MSAEPRVEVLLERYGDDVEPTLFAHEPEAVELRRGAVVLSYGPDLAYAVLERGEVLEIRTRPTFLDVYAFSRAGRYLGCFAQPLGDPTSN